MNAHEHETERCSICGDTYKLLELHPMNDGSGWQLCQECYESEFPANWCSLQMEGEP